jgi:hypothetical protein
MPQISNFYGIVIYLYFFDHNPPHFHARYGEYEVLIAISDLSIIKGELPGRAFALVMEWAMIHRSEILKSWEEAQKGLKPSPIEPLK